MFRCESSSELKMGKSSEQGASIQSVERALDVLLLFTEARAELGVVEVARELDVANSTAHRLLAALMAKGFVEQSPENQKYRLGVRLLGLGRVASSHRDVRETALPTMGRLQRQTGETVNLNVMWYRHRVCIEMLESQADIRFAVQVGRPLPVHLGASGKVLMAHLEPQELDELLHALETAPEDPVPAHAIGPLREELKGIRARGYAVSSGERVHGVGSISAPVRRVSGAVVASLTVSGPDFRFTASKVSELVGRLLEATNQISRSLGHEVA